MKLRESIEWIRTALTDPVAQLSRWQKSIRHAYRVGRFSVRHLSEDRASQMAATLSFRMLFGLLPVLVVATVVAKSVLGDRLPEIVERAVNALGMDGVQLVLPASVGETAKPVSLGVWASELVAYAASFDLSTLGWIGFGVVAFSAIWVLVTIETCFNEICRAPKARSWWARIPIYWFALTFGPIALAVLPILNSRVGEAMREVADFGGWTHVVSGVVDFLLVWAFWFAAYLWVPNTRMQAKPVLVGAFVTAVLLMLGRSFLGLYLRNAFSLSGLYGSLGLVPLFMFWTYLMWMFVLLGLQIASLLQALRHRRIEDLEEEAGRTDFVDPARILSVMEYAARRFEAGESLETDDAAATLSLPPGAVARMVEALVAKGHLHRIEGGESYTLSRPPSQIAAEELVDLGFSLADRGQVADGWLARARDAQRRLAAGASLAAIPPAAPAP
ncbi:MAG: YihY/virulence factor BrkB family protein [Phycisphaerales bacterium]